MQACILWEVHPGHNLKCPERPHMLSLPPPPTSWGRKEAALMEQDKRLAPLPTATPEKTCGLLGVSPSCHQARLPCILTFYFMLWKSWRLSFFVHLAWLWVVFLKINKRGKKEWKNPVYLNTCERRAQTPTCLPECCMFKSKRGKKYLVSQTANAFFPEFRRTRQCLYAYGSLNDKRLSPCDSSVITMNYCQV